MQAWISPSILRCLFAAVRSIQLENAAKSFLAPVISAKITWVLCRSCVPAGVIRTLRPIRSKSLQPRSLSSALIAWLTADWVNPSSLAACVKLSTRANVAKANSLRLSKMICGIGSNLALGNVV